MKSLENKMKQLIKFLFLMVILSGLVVSCVDVPEPEPEPLQNPNFKVQDDNSENNLPGSTVSISILKNDYLVSGKQAVQDSVIIDLNLDINDIQTTLQINGEGNWVYSKSTGLLTFSPIKELYTNPAPIKYKLSDISNRNSSTANVVIGYKLPPLRTIKINEFIEAVMNDVYLWNRNVPNIDIRQEFDSKVYFDKLLFTEDKWSFLTDDVKKLEDSFQGRETSYGWSLAFGRFSDTKTIFALVEFVYPNTPADKAGVKRGDLIYKMNGADITENNYMELINSASMLFTYGQYTNSGISNVKTANMTSLELNLDPVQFTKIIEHGGRKIGYLFYAQFIGNYNSSIDAALQYFLDNKITDLVIDLRYNPGGTTVAAQHLCSSLAPVDIVNAEKTLVKFQWNDKYQKYWQDKNNQDQLGIGFIKSVPLKLGLTKLHIITGPGTASASELTITGLKPYMSVTTVGETTYGKYTASITLKPEDFYDNPTDYKDFTTWAVQPIILKYANSQGVTDFKNGFVADIKVEDDLFSPIPLGDKTEAMLRVTLKAITGVEVVAMKSAKIIDEYTIFDRGFSKFDANKRELLIDGFNSDFLK